VKVVYSDEAGTSGSTKEPITVVVAIMLNMDSQWDSVEAAIEAAIKSPARLKLLEDRKEIKGSILFNKIERNRSEAREARQMLAELLAVVHNNWITVFHAAVDRAGFEKRGAAFADYVQGVVHKIKTPEQSAFVKCLEHVEHFFHTKSPDEKVIWIADRNYYQEKSFLKSARLHRSAQTVDLNKLLNVSVKFTAPRASRIADTVYFGDSKESRALQLADVCAATISRTVNQRPFGREFYQFIKDDVSTQGWGVDFADSPELGKLLL
jgi:hypothetical protein